MKPRKVLAIPALLLLGSLTAAADEQAPIPTIGFLHTGDAKGFSHLAAALREGLQTVGYSEGQNVKIEYRWADNDRNRLAELASDLVRQRVSVIFAAGGPPGVLAAKRATTTIPIVFVASDPMRFGLVKSLSRPEANLTGVSMFTASVGSKRLELMRQLVPTANRIGFLIDPTNLTTGDELKDMQRAADGAGVELIVIRATSPTEIDPAFVQFERTKVQALIVAAASFFTSSRLQIIRLAEQRHLPTIYFQHEFPADGGLMSYGNNLAASYKLAATYIGKILHGAKPSELPIIQPNEFQLVINLTAAKQLGLVIPMPLQAAADEVIE